MEALMTRREQIRLEVRFNEYSPELLEEAELQGEERDLFLDMAFRSIGKHDGNLDGFYSWWYHRKLWQRNHGFDVERFGLSNPKIDEYEDEGNTWPNQFTADLG